MKGSRLLIVESDDTARSALAAPFSARGWEVVSARSTAEALMCLDPPPDCVILDLMQPDKGGELLLWKIRSEKLPIRVVVTAGGCDGERAQVVRRLHPDAFFEKPVDPEALYRACGEGAPDQASEGPDSTSGPSRSESPGADDLPG